MSAFDIWLLTTTGRDAYEILVNHYALPPGVVRQTLRAAYDAGRDLQAGIPIAGRIQFKDLSANPKRPTKPPPPPTPKR